MTKIPINAIEPCLLQKEYRGVWAHYWEEICIYHKTFTMNEKKDLFLFLIEKMIKEKKLKVKHPTAPGWWEIPAAEIANYLREKWPQKLANPENINDLVLWDYFYSMPFPCWLNEDDVWQAP